MNETPIKYTADPGTTINEACAMASQLAASINCIVWLYFNETQVEVTPGMRPSDAVDQYFSKRNQPQPNTMNEPETKHSILIRLPNGTWARPETVQSIAPFKHPAQVTVIYGDGNQAVIPCDDFAAAQELADRIAAAIYETA